MLYGLLLPDIILLMAEHRFSEGGTDPIRMDQHYRYDLQLAYGIYDHLQDEYSSALARSGLSRRKLREILENPFQEVLKPRMIKYAADCGLLDYEMYLSSFIESDTTRRAVLMQRVQTDLISGGIPWNITFFTTDDFEIAEGLHISWKAKENDVLDFSISRDGYGLYSLTQHSVVAGERNEVQLQTAAARWVFDPEYGFSRPRSLIYRNLGTNLTASNLGREFGIDLQELPVNTSADFYAFISEMLSGNPVFAGNFSPLHY